MIDKELALGQIAGPFEQPPFTNFTVSPLGMVPKKESNKYRMIHDLSSLKHASLNSLISSEDASVSYETLDNVVHLIQKHGLRFNGYNVY